MGGTILSLPFAWLLSYAAALPFLLGLFFFVLFGLVIGACVFRIAGPGGRYPVWALGIGTMLVVATCWSASVVKEGRDFPRDMAERIAARTRDIGDRSIEQFQAEVADQVRDYLQRSYPPGGVFGYVRWVLTNGLLRTGDVASVKRTLSAPHAGVWWIVREVLALGLLAFGVASQTMPLRTTRTWVAAHTRIS